MGEPRQTPATPVEPTRTPEREETRSSKPATSISSDQKCEVLRDSCKNPATIKITFPSGSTVFCCDEHKQTVVDVYPNQELVFEKI